ncbi:hypothetical protein PR202_gb03651 [Eleusine coracana subsp. coracana]|uniref:Uncharacterized protein n=1 Tax=Eleusine coracana subsp. coracana TaxID=191504 RepID=A0AAV5E1G8_ELECO|nr:hypothetical protein PR202_gb03651 [Eleusine coracana subsp. coracana]
MRSIRQRRIQSTRVRIGSRRRSPPPSPRAAPASPSTNNTRRKKPRSKRAMDITTISRLHFTDSHFSDSIHFGTILISM